MLHWLAIVSVIKILIIVGVVMSAAAYLVLVERWIAAWVQMRRGPNRVGIPLTNIRVFGLGQPLADGLKFIFKEEYVPAHVDRRLFLLAPIVIMASALAVFAVIPVGETLPAIPWLGLDSPVALMVAPGVDVGVLYVFAVSSIAVYGVILGGWASNSKFSLLGALRSSAQLISYELPLGLGLLGVVLATGSLRLEDIVGHQAETGLWFAFTQPLGMLVFLVAAFAEAARLPFDLPEAEQELVGGYHTEYSGVKLLLFLTAEFIHMITAALLMVLLFLGGWHFWVLTEDTSGWTQVGARGGVLTVKTLLMILVFMLVRWTWPRFRYDQLMALAWKVMLPLGMINLVAVALLGELAGGLPPLALVAAGWLVAVVAWVGMAYAGPLITQNRPAPPRFLGGVPDEV